MAEDFKTFTSEEEVKFLWDRDNPEDPYTRDKKNIPDFYRLDNWVVRYKDGYVVGVAGWKDHGDFAVFGGMKAMAKNHPSGRGGDNAIALLNKRKELIGNKPKIAGFRPEKMGAERWTNWNVNQGYVRAPDSFENVPEEWLEMFRERYGDHWGVMKFASWRNTITMGSWL